MILLTVEQVIYLHKQMINVTGGLAGLRDLGQLEAALNVPFQTYAGEELYPSLFGKAARLCYGLIQNHAFLDGNKRIGIYAMLVFLEVNNAAIACTDEELVSLGLAVAAGKMNDREILSWLLAHKK